MNKILILLCFMSLQACATGIPQAHLQSNSDLNFNSNYYHRFWRGFQKEGLSQVDFETKINRDFFSLFPESIPYGLKGYHPVLVNRVMGIPPEFALVSYQSQADYEQFKQSAPGRIAGAAHWDVFQPKVSYSVVPEPYLGKIELEHAYQLHPDFKDGQNSVVVFILQKQTVGLQPYSLQHNEELPTLQNAFFLSTDQYMAEYLFFKADSNLEILKKMGDQKNWLSLIFLKPGSPGQNWIREGEGLHSSLKIQR